MSLILISILLLPVLTNQQQQLSQQLSQQVQDPQLNNQDANFSNKLKIVAFTPKGLRMVMQHEDGMEVLTVIANINRALTLTDNSGDIKQEVKTPKNNRWIINIPNLVLKNGDNLNYKFAMRKFGKTYFSGLLNYKIKALMQLPISPSESIVWPGNPGSPLSVGNIPPPITHPSAAVHPAPPNPGTITTTKRPLPNRPGSKPPPANSASSSGESCPQSLTKVKGKSVCKGALIFEDNFNMFDKSKWKHTVQIADKPDYEFCIYDDRPENSYVKNGVLTLAPTLTERVFDKHFMNSGQLTLEDCTGSNSGECEMRASYGYVMPAVISSSLTSTFAFQYGRVEIKAKMALGDWLLSRLLLQPLRTNFYGPDYVSGQIRVAMSRGNKNLLCQGLEEGISQVAAGVILAAPNIDEEDDNSNNIYREFVKRELPRGYAAEFHVYQLQWYPNKLTFSVDGKVITTINSPEGGFSSQFDGLDDDPWKKGSNIAPFDREFVVKLNLACGGILDFSDNCINSGKPKPWKNRNPKARLNFYQNQSIWAPTWKTPMQIDYVKIWAV